MQDSVIGMDIAKQVFQLHTVNRSSGTIERISGHDPYAYLKDVLTRLPTQRVSEIGQLLPNQWTPA